MLKQFVFVTGLSAAAGIGVDDLRRLCILRLSQKQHFTAQSVNTASTNT
jgi:hypothetical protein